MHRPTSLVTPRLVPDWSKESTTDSQQLVMLTINMALAVEYLLSSGIVHRDIRLKNFSIDTKTSKVILIDTGMTRSLDGNAVFFDFGHLNPHVYTAPELVESEEGIAIRYSAQTDIYALGVCFGELFQNTNIIVPRRMINLIVQMLNHNAESRPTITTVIKELYNILNREANLEKSSMTFS